MLRNSLGLKAVEIPDFKAQPLAEATPVFSDDLITVFSIPIVPTPRHTGEVPAGSEAMSNVSENILKRKRDSSPELSSKRPSLSSTIPATDEPPTPSMNPPLLDRYLVDTNFDPATLEGDEADAWRQLIIEHMFTWLEPPPKPRLPPKRANKKGKRERNMEGSETQTAEAQPSQASLTPLPQIPHWVEGAAQCQEPPRRGPKGANPAGSLKPLPSFTLPVRDGSTAYIVVGPQVRGRLDAKRARELGLKGPLIGRVTRGEIVTITVDDGTGAKVERTVRPEDCLGEPETVKVSLPISVPCLLC